MALPTNVLQQVQTYQESALAYLENLCCFTSTSNTRFKDFNKLEANLGDTVTFDLPPRYVTGTGLVVNFQPSQQRVLNLTVDQAFNTSYAFTAQQFIFNVEEYMQKFAMSALKELASKTEIQIARCADSSMPVMTIDSNGNSVPTGALHTESGPYRYYGDGITPINSYGQLGDMLARFREFGTTDEVKCYLPNLAISSIINSGLNQFVPNRNNEIAMSWMVGDFDEAQFFRSNLLPLHTSGNVGNNQDTLTVTSTNDPTGANITQISFSGASVHSDSNAIFSGDMAQFQDGVSGQPNMRWLTFIGHNPTGLQLQFRVTANAASDSSGNVTVNITPPLSVTPGPNQNINNNIVAGMQVKFLPNHKAGLVTAGRSLFLAMPALPDEVPFPTSTMTDDQTGVSTRLYYGTLFGKNQRGLIHDLIFGAVQVPEYSMRIAFPA